MKKKKIKWNLFKNKKENCNKLRRNFPFIKINHYYIKNVNIH